MVHERYSTKLAGVSVTVVVLAVITVFYWMHCLFACITAHTAATMPVF